MTTHGAVPHANSAGCNFTAGFPDDERRCVGWSTDLADDVDEVTVDRLVAGVSVSYTSWERREAVRRLRRQGLSVNEVAVRLGIHERQVDRDLAALGLIDAGLWDRRKAAAAIRRAVIPELVRHGLRREEIRRLLDIGERALSRDFDALGIHGTGRRGPFPVCRNRTELLGAYGHLLASVARSAAS